MPSRAAATTRVCWVTSAGRLAPAPSLLFFEVVFFIFLPKALPRSTFFPGYRSANIPPGNRVGVRLSRVIQEQPGVGEGPVEIKEIAEAAGITPPHGR